MERQCLGGLLHQLVQLAGPLPQLAHHVRVGILLLHPIALQQLVHKSTVAVVGGHAAGRGMGLENEAPVLQCR